MPQQQRAQFSPSRLVPPPPLQTAVCAWRLIFAKAWAQQLTSLLAQQGAHKLLADLKSAEGVAQMRQYLDSTPLAAASPAAPAAATAGAALEQHAVQQAQQEQQVHQAPDLQQP